MPDQEVAWNLWASQLWEKEKRATWQCDRQLAEPWTWTASKVLALHYFGLWRALGSSLYLVGVFGSRFVFSHPESMCFANVSNSSVLRVVLQVWCRLLMPRKFNKIITEFKSEVGIDSGCENSFTNSSVQNSPENQLAIVSAKKERSSVQDLVAETDSEALPTTLWRKFRNEPPRGCSNNVNCCNLQLFLYRSRYVKRQLEFRLR